MATRKHKPGNDLTVGFPAKAVVDGKEVEATLFVPLGKATVDVPIMNDQPNRNNNQYAPGGLRELLPEEVPCTSK